MRLSCCYVVLVCQFAAATGFASAVWIDTHPAIGSPIREVDDGFALVLAFHSPELQIAGISSTYGNAPLRQTTRVARALTADFGAVAGMTPARVFAGASSRADLGRSTP